MATATDTLATFAGLNRSWLSNMSVEESARTGFTHKVVVNAKDIAARALAQDTPLTGATDELTFIVMALAANANSDSAITDACMIVSKVFTSSTAGTLVCDVSDAAGSALILPAITLMTTGTGLPVGTAIYTTLPDDENPLLDVGDTTQGTAIGNVYMNFLNAVAETGLDDLTDGELTLFLKVRESSNMI